MRLCAHFSTLTEQWRGRRWIGTALDRFGPRLDCISSTVVSVAAAVAHHKRISSSSSPQLTRTTTTCQVSRNRHHLPAPADRRTRAPPSPRLSPRRRRRQRAGQSGLAPWPTTRTTGPSTHHRPRRVSPSPCFSEGFSRKPGKRIESLFLVCVWCTSQGIVCHRNSLPIAQRSAIECLSRMIALRLSMQCFFIGECLT